MYMARFRLMYKYLPIFHLAKCVILIGADISGSLVLWGLLFNVRCSFKNTSLLFLSNPRSVAVTYPLRLRAALKISSFFMRDMNFTIMGL